ncbi:Bug family tripartite tricarboxylate transporter substrate binding protein [Falsiroseomonas oryzae]|uniref:Bug family tripartite tricarboxylate transporter substrate binding protein n=1 Tax=Falsiroseomonas oryzae TaxID=2766473 RepID=UPI0022EAAFB3|nr:tripartite tricarboxylate transporter substrate binding protein [Roseomonas sp. MO-31]
MIHRRILPAVAAGLLAAPARAQSPDGSAAWPNRPIRLVVPLPPGGAADLIGRIQAQVLSDGLGVPVVVDNRPGAGSTLGTAFVAQAAPDGYTIMLASPSSHLGAPLLMRTPGYEGVDDFTQIGSFSAGTALVCVNNALPIRSIPDLVAHAKANPGRLNFGSAGAGGANHMLGVLFMQRAGVEFTHVPYRGGAPALADLIAGNIQLVFDSFAGIIGAVRAGQVRALAVTSKARWPLAPEFPTVQEGGVPDYDLPSFSMVVGPKGIPEPIVRRMNQVINSGLQRPEIIARMTPLGIAPLPGTPAEATALMREQRANWQALVRSIGLQPE